MITYMPVTYTAYTFASSTFDISLLINNYKTLKQFVCVLLRHVW